MSSATWRRVRLDDVCARITVGHVGSMASEYVEEGVPFLRSQNIAPFRLRLDDVKFIRSEFHHRLRKSALRPGDVAVTRTGYPGVAAVVPANLPDVNCADLVVISPLAKDLDPYYLAAIFNSTWGRATVAGNLVGVAQQHFNIGAARNLEIDLPQLVVQRYIAGILSAYDDLIENCERRIRVLDEMARALYREWFVLFRYPGHEKTPIIQSPIGHVPKGWAVEPLDRLKAAAPYAINGGPFGSKLVTKDYVAEGIPVIRGSNLSEDGRFRAEEFVFVSHEKARELSANLARPGDIVVTQRGTLGQVGRIPQGTGYDAFVISQSQMKVRLNDERIDAEYAFFVLRSPETAGRIKNLASSSGVPHINLAVLREFCVLVPPLALQRRFGAFATRTESSIESLVRQCRALRRTRDLLLPRLLSGQISVEDAA